MSSMVSLVSYHRFFPPRDTWRCLFMMTQCSAHWVTMVVETLVFAQCSKTEAELKQTGCTS